MTAVANNVTPDADATVSPAAEAPATVTQRSGASEREVDSAAFDGVVTRRAEAHEIGQIVRIVRSGERADRPDMVNVERLPVRDDLAPAARSAVAGPCRAPRGAPIGAVILRMSALPGRVVGPLPEGVTALERAEVEPGLSQPAPFWILESHAAFGADERAKYAHAAALLCALLVRIPPSLSDHVGLRDNAPRGARRSALVMACSRTEDAVFGHLEFRWRALDGDTACPARMRRFGFRVRRPRGGISALSRARLFESDLDSVLRGGERATARLARCVNHLGHVGSVAHKRIERK